MNREYSIAAAAVGVRVGERAWRHHRNASEIEPATHRSAKVRSAAEIAGTTDGRPANGRHLAVVPVIPYGVHKTVTFQKPTAPAANGHARPRRRSDKIQLLIVDEHPLLRAGVRTLLENAHDV